MFFLGDETDVPVGLPVLAKNSYKEFSVRVVRFVVFSSFLTVSSGAE
ncbi:MAG: hypothetical protein MRZ91_03700 [Christensenellaceae bacterium]|nr:hypothetical protein [Christensenellaceae bacterium]